jgi:hypothetical protein
MLVIQHINRFDKSFIFKPIRFPNTSTKHSSFPGSLGFFQGLFGFFFVRDDRRGSFNGKNVINKLKGNFAVLDLSPGGAASYFFKNNAILFYQNCSDLL